MRKNMGEEQNQLDTSHTEHSGCISNPGNIIGGKVMFLRKEKVLKYAFDFGVSGRATGLAWAGCACFGTRSRQLKFEIGSQAGPKFCGADLVVMEPGDRWTERGRNWRSWILCGGTTRLVARP